MNNLEEDDDSFNATEEELAKALKDFEDLLDELDNIDLNDDKVDIYEVRDSILYETTLAYSY